MTGRGRQLAGAGRGRGRAGAGKRELWDSKDELPQELGSHFGQIVCHVQLEATEVEDYEATIRLTASRYVVPANAGRVPRAL